MVPGAGQGGQIRPSPLTEWKTAKSPGKPGLFCFLMMDAEGKLAPYMAALFA
jgi:hypothetical protein